MGLCSCDADPKCPIHATEVKPTDATPLDVTLERPAMKYQAPRLDPPEVTPIGNLNDLLSPRPPASTGPVLCAACGLLIFQEPIYLQGAPYHVVGCFAAGLKQIRRVLRPLVDIDCASLHPQAAFEAGLQVGTVPKKT